LIAAAVGSIFSMFWQYLSKPTIVALKYPGAGFGKTGLHSRWKPSTTSPAVIWRGPSAASQLAPSLIRNV
jgi:hypothetical protein